MTPANPQTFVIHEECGKAAWQHGFRRVLGEADGWASFGSTTATGLIWLGAASDQGPWFLALDHPGVAGELDHTNVVDIEGPGVRRYAFPTLSALYNILPRVYQLAVSLPDAPLREFQRQTASLPRTTDAERLVVQRIGQDIFRESLMEYWQSRCPLTGITDPALLRASHIIPWSECEGDSQRLDVYNGLLLSALWDAAFDRYLVTFNDDGEPVYSKRISTQARSLLIWQEPLNLTELHRANLVVHRLHFTEVEKSSSATDHPPLQQ
mgnify:CR=1 FL=1